MGDGEKCCSNLNSKWSQEENKLFEVALAIVDEKCPRRWEWVALMVGNKKTAEEVQKHFEILVEDVNFIESCFLFDHMLGLEISDIGSCRRQDQEQREHKNYLIELRFPRNRDGIRNLQFRMYSSDIKYKRS